MVLDTRSHPSVWASHAPALQSTGARIYRFGYVPDVLNLCVKMTSIPNAGANLLALSVFDVAPLVVYVFSAFIRFGAATSAAIGSLFAVIARHVGPSPIM